MRSIHECIQNDLKDQRFREYYTARRAITNRLGENGQILEEPN